MYYTTTEETQYDTLYISVCSTKEVNMDAQKKHKHKKTRAQILIRLKRNLSAHGHMKVNSIVSPKCHCKRGSATQKIDSHSMHNA